MATNNAKEVSVAAELRAQVMENEPNLRQPVIAAALDAAEALEQSGSQLVLLRGALDAANAELQQLRARIYGVLLLLKQ